MLHFARPLESLPASFLTRIRFGGAGLLRFAAPGSMVALDIKPSSGLCTHERMTAYIASKGVTELYADSLEALLRAEPDNPAEFLADHFASLTEHVESYADTYVPAPPRCTCGPRVPGLLRTGGAGPPASGLYCTHKPYHGVFASCVRFTVAPPPHRSGHLLLLAR